MNHRPSMIDARSPRRLRRRDFRTFVTWRSTRRLSAYFSWLFLQTESAGCYQWRSEVLSVSAGVVGDNAHSKVQRLYQCVFRSINHKQKAGPKKLYQQSPGECLESWAKKRTPTRKGKAEPAKSFLRLPYLVLFTFLRWPLGEGNPVSRVSFFVLAAVFAVVINIRLFVWVKLEFEKWGFLSSFFHESL